MATFDLDGYLAQRAKQTPSSEFDPIGKIGEVLQASKEKQNELAQYRAELHANSLRNEQSLINQLGLDPDSNLASFVNLGMATANDLAQVPGSIAYGLHAAKADFLDRALTEDAPTKRPSVLERMGGLPADQRAALTRQFKEARDQAKVDAQTVKDAFDFSSQIRVDPETGERMSGLGQRIVGDGSIALLNSAISVPEAAVGLASLVSGGYAGKVLEEAGFRPQEAKQFLNALKSHELQAANQSVHGAEGFWNTLGQIVENPASVPDMLIESLFPMLAGGVAARGIQALGTAAKLAGIGAWAPALGEGTVMAGSAAENIRQQTKDRLLTAGQTAAALATGVIGAGVARLGHAVGTRLGVGDIDAAVTAGTLGTTKRGALAQTLGAGTIEAAEEMGQSAPETILENVALDRPWDKGVGNAVAIGGVTGFAMGAPMGLAEHVGEVQETKAKDQAKTQDQFLKAVQSRDVSAYLDPKSAQYNPAEAARALLMHSALPTTDDATRTENLKQVQDMATELETLVQNRQAKYDENSPETYQAIKAQMLANQQALKATDPANTAQVEALTQRIQDAQDFLEVIKGNAKANQAVKARLDAAQAHLETVRKIQDVLAGQTQNDTTLAPDQVDAVVRQATAPVETSNTEALASKQSAAQQVLTLAMKASDQVSGEVALQLADDMDNGLAEAQRTYLREFSAARIAEHALKSTQLVGKDITDGSKTYLGMQDYQRRIGSAIATGNEKTAQYHLNLLKSFAADRTQRLAVLKQAYSQLEDQPIHVLKDQKQGWVISTAPMSEATVKKLGGFTFRPGLNYASKILPRFQAEHDLVQATLKELGSAVALNFKSEASPLSSTVPTQDASVVSTDSTGVNSVNLKQPPVASTSIEDQKTVEGNQYNGEDSVNSVESEPIPSKPTAIVEKPTQQAPVEQRQAPKKGKGSRLKPNPDLTAKVQKWINDLRAMAPDTGWAERGGLLLRDSNHNVIGRTKWVPNAEWFAAGMEGNAQKLLQAIEDVNAGLGAFAKSRRTIEWMTEWLEQQTDALTLPEESALYDFNGMPEIPGMDVLVEEVDTLYDPEASDEISREDMERMITALEANIEGNPNADDTQNVLAESTESVQQDDAGTAEASTPVSETADGSQGSESEQAAEVTRPEGTLDVLTREPAPKGTLIKALAREGKLFVTYVTQTLQREGDTTSRPLVAVKDFLTRWINKDLSILDFLPFKQEDITAEQARFVKLFRELAPRWNQRLRTSLEVWKTSNKDFLFKDPIQELLVQDEDGKADLPENIKTALSYAAFSWLVESASRPQSNSDEDINQLLNRDAETPVLETERELFRYTVAQENTVSNTLGQRAVQALGLAAKPNAPMNFLPNLEAALGVHALFLLQKEKLVTVTTLTDEARVERGYVSLVRQENALSPQIQKILESSKGSRGVLDQLFSVEPGLLEPSFTPVDFTQTHTKTGQVVPKALAEILQRDNHQPNTIKQDVWNAFEALDEDILVLMAGGEIPSKTATRRSRIDGINARNEALLREIQMLRDFVEFSVMRQSEGLETPFYFEHDVWSQQRVGIKNNVANPQMSKVARHLIQRQGWATTVDTQNEEAFNHFKLRVLEGLGTKTGNESNAQSLTRLQALFDPNASLEGLPSKEVERINTLNAAVDVLVQRMQDAPFTREMQETLLAGVQAGGESFFSFDALVAVANLRFAQHHGKTTFPTTLMGEIDGVSNGPILAHLLFGAADSPEALSKFLEKGGFYTQQSGEVSYNLWRAQPGHLDLYESMTKAAFATLARHKKESNKAFLYDAIQVFTGDLMKDGAVTSAGRNLSKDPIRPLVFGSAKQRALESMAEAYLEAIDKKLEKLPDTLEARMNAIKAINTMLYQVPKLPMNLSHQALMQLEFSPEQQKAIKSSFRQTFGKAYDEAIETELAVFLSRRKEITRTAELVFTLYDTAYQTLREAYIQELIQKGELEAGQTGKPLNDLSKTQEKAFLKRIEGLLPRMHTAFSAPEGDLNKGLPVYSSEVKRSDDPLYSPEVHLAPGHGKKTRSPHAQQRVLGSSGVRMTSMPIHAMDSATSHRADPEGNSLNIHDARGMGLELFTETGRKLNQALWNTALEYSPLQELSDSLERTIQSVAQLLQRKEIPDNLRQNLAQALEAFGNKHEIDPATVVGLIMGSIKDTAYVADRNKLGVLEQVVSVDQYSSEGAHYPVTNEDRAKASEKLADLENQRKLAEKTETGIHLISNMMAPHLSGQTSEKSAAPSAPVSLRELFYPTKTVSTQDAMTSLARYLEQASKGRGTFRQDLLKRLIEHVPATVQVHAVTSDMKVETRPEGAQGWYVLGGDIYLDITALLSSEEAVAETLLHELTHAALAAAIEQGKAGNGAAKQFVTELEDLRQVALKFVETNQLNQHQEAVSSVHELVSWGLTNRAFQQEVLSKIEVAPWIKGAPLISGLRSFYESAIRFLFPKLSKSGQEIATNGLAVLVANVSGLMELKAQAATGETQVFGHIPHVPGQAYTTTEILDALPDTLQNAAFKDHLRSVLTGIVRLGYGDAGTVGDKVVFQNAPDVLTAWDNAKTSGEAPFASKIPTNVQLTEQEAFVAEQVEATVRAALTDDRMQTHTVVRELHKLYRDAQAALAPKDFHPGDWLTATPTEQQLAQDRYDFLFKMEKTNGDRTDHLSRFVALGLSSQSFNQVLQRPLADQSKAAPQTLADKLQRWFENLLTWFAHWRTHTYAGQNADERLERLTRQLVLIEAKRQQQLLTQSPGSQVLSRIEQGTKTLVEKAKRGIAAAATSSIVQNYTTGLGKLAGTAIGVAARNQADVVMQHITHLYNQRTQDHSNLLTSLLNDTRGMGQVFDELQRMAKRDEVLRQDLHVQVAQVVKTGFTQPLSKEENAASTAVFLRTGVHVLLDQFSLNELQQFLGNPATLDQAIQAQQAQLAQFANHQTWYANQSKLLGYYLATGKVADPSLMFNARSISMLQGSNQAMQTPTAQTQQAEPIIDALASLYALQYSGTEAKRLARQVLIRDGQGIERAMQLQKSFEQDSKAKLFTGKEVLMTKGYLPEIHNPYRDVQMATLAEGQALEDQGYRRGAKLERDPNDPDQAPRFIYVMDDGGLSRWATGSISFTGEGTRGSRLHNGFLHAWDAQGYANLQLQQRMDAARRAAANRLMNAANFDPAQVQQRFMAPVINGDGQVVNYRYIMTHAARDSSSVLQRDNRMEEILGKFASSLFDKAAAPKQNETVLKALHEVFQKDFAKNPKNFVKIHHDSANEELREIYSLLPDATRQQIKTLWGKSGMYVPKELVYPVFGYRKRSLSTLFEQTAKNDIEKMFTFFVEEILRNVARLKGKDPDRYAKRAAMVVRKSEHILRETVGVMKDMIVIRSWTTLRDNIKSNVGLLFLTGVPLKDFARHHLVALKAGRAYQLDRAALLKVETLLKTTQPASEKQWLEREKLRLEDALARNPVKPLIEGGLMPTIVEDLEANEDIYSYKSALSQKTHEMTEWVPEGFKEAGRWVMMAPSTPIHQVLRRLTSLSDFAARYVLYMHLTENQGMAKDDALFEASEAFVNYDRAMHPTLQYLDDHGFILFTKYFLRIQRVIARQVRDRPLRVLSLLALQNVFGNLAPVTDSSLLAHFGNNPLEPSALGIFNAEKHIATLQLGMSMIK